MLSTQQPTPSSLGHLPREDRWVFDDSVATVFPDMLRRSIPQYDVMRQGVFDIGRRFVRPSTQIVDLGCSRGDAMAPFVAAFGANNCHVGIDTSEPMLASARERFAVEIARGYVGLSALDLRSAYPHGATSLTLCVLTLQFTPIEYRRQILRQAFRNTVPGGALIVVEKVLGNGPVLGPLLVDLYHDMKAANGYSHEEIERKRLALEGVLVPLTAPWNEDLLARAGFEEVECFWRWMNFAAWVAVKQEP